jgi:hypothetical protein
MSRYELAQLRAHGPSPRAFTFKPAYPAPDDFAAREPHTVGGECPV